jgi:hypothetical protein
MWQDPSSSLVTLHLAVAEQRFEGCLLLYAVRHCYSPRLGEGSVVVKWVVVAWP